jgi:flagellar assembly protein FliH
MQSSYNVIKKDYISSNTVYTVKAPLISIKNVQANVCETDKLDSVDPAKYAEDVIEKAVQKSRELLDDARSEAERIKRAAYDSALNEGRKKGLEQGMAEGLQRAEGTRQEALHVLEETHRISREYIEGKKEEIVDLAVKIAAKIIGYEASMDDSIIAAIASEAVAVSVAREQAVIRVNPMDYAILDCRRDELAKAAGDNCIISIIRDDQISRGGCRVDTEVSSVDATIENQLDKIKQALMGR